MLYNIKDMEDDFNFDDDYSIDENKPLPKEKAKETAY